jgi:hypothetical protein
MGEFTLTAEAALKKPKEIKEKKIKNSLFMPISKKKKKEKKKRGQKEQRNSLSTAAAQ